MLPVGHVYVSSRPINRKEFILEHIDLWFELSGKGKCAKIIMYDETRDMCPKGRVIVTNIQQPVKQEFLVFDNQADFEESEAWMQWYCAMFFNNDNEMMQSRRFPVYVGSGTMVSPISSISRCDSKLQDILIAQWKMIIPKATGRVGLFTDFTSEPHNFVTGENENNQFFWLFENEHDAVVFRLTCDNLSISV